MLDPERRLIELLEIPSPSGAETAAVEYVAELLATTFPHATVTLQDVGDGTANVLMRQGSPRLTFTSHVDTVPGWVNVRSEGGTVFGRGACDAKGQVIAQVCAMELAWKRGVQDLGCFYVVGEEVDSRGAIVASVTHNPSGEYVLNGEPTSCRFAARGWGIVELELATSGERAHSSREDVPAATHRLVRDLARLLDLRSDDWMINIGTLGGGIASNVTAPHAEAFIGIRLRCGSRTVLEEVETAIQASKVTVRQVIEPQIFCVPPAATETAEVRFSSDAQYYAGNFEHVMQFGPGNIAFAHADNEAIEVAELHAAIDILAGLAQQFSET